MADCDSTPALTPFNIALEQLLSQVHPHAKYEDIPLLKACGRVLAQDVVSHVNVPPSDNSAMDGYALASEDMAEYAHFVNVADVLAGHPAYHDISPSLL